MDQQATGSQGSRPRSCTKEHKRQVVDLVASTGRVPTSVAAEVGIHHTLLSRWMRQYGQPARSAVTAMLPPRPTLACSFEPLPVLHADQAAKIAQLRRENERLRMERDLLKKGSGRLCSAVTIRFCFIEDHHTAWPVPVTGGVLQVSPSGYCV